MQIDFFVLDGPPQPLGEDVVHRSPPAVHADLYLSSQQAVQILGTGKVAALIAVADRRMRLGQGPIHRFQHEGLFQGLAERPADHVAGEPVQDDHQVQPAAPQPDVGEVDAPDVIGVADGHLTQQIRINLALQDALAGMGSWIDARQPHFAHAALHQLTVDGHFLTQYRRDPPGAVEGILGVDLIDAVLERYFPGGRRHRLVVQARAVQVHELGLLDHRQFRRLTFDHDRSRLSTRGDRQIF